MSDYRVLGSAVFLLGETMLLRKLQSRSNERIMRTTKQLCNQISLIDTFFREGGVVSLHLLQLAFGDRKRLASGQVMYEVRRARM